MNGILLDMFNSSEIRNENIQGSIIINQVNQILPKSAEYNNLLEQLAREEKYFKRLAADEEQERLETSKRINDLKDFIEQFKKDVLQLAQGFQSVKIDTDRLKRAKAFFDKGEIGEARAVFETELEAMRDNHARLVDEKKRFETETLPALRHDAEEFYILALSNRFDYANPNRFDDTSRHFETSIESEATRDNLFQYAYFLYENAQFQKAVDYYNQFLDKFADELSATEKISTFNNLGISHWKQNEYEEAAKQYNQALEVYRSSVTDSSNIVMTLNNLAILHWNQREFEKAEAGFAEVLEIYRSLAANNPQTYSPRLADTLNNLANLHNDRNEYEKSAQEFAEALEIYRNLDKDKSQIYLPSVAMTLNNLAILHRNQNEYEKALNEYEESLKIARKLAQENPQAYLLKVAMTLNNLANLRADRKEHEKAAVEFEEALEIYRNLAKNDLQTYLPDVAMTLNNLAIAHNDLKEYEKAAKEFAEALEIYRNLAADNSQIYLPDVAMTLNNLASLHNDLREFEKASEEFEEALRIRRDLHRQMPDVYTPDLGMTLINLAVFYKTSVADREKSIEYAAQAVILLYPIIETVPFTQEYIQNGFAVLRSWNLSDEEIQRLIEEKMKETGENQA